MFRRIWPATILMFPAVLSLGVTTSDAPKQGVLIEQRELKFSGSFARASQFASVPHVSSRPSCEDAEPPEALATPNPLFSPSARGNKVKVSFIIGIDGRVHSPLILESSGLLGDWHVLRAVRSWRYRPATCNGIPTETEGKVEFSSR